MAILPPRPLPGKPTDAKSKPDNPKPDRPPPTEPFEKEMPPTVPVTDEAARGVAVLDPSKPANEAEPPVAASRRVCSRRDMASSPLEMPSDARMRLAASAYSDGAMFKPDMMDVRYPMVASARGANPNELSKAWWW